MWKLNARLHNRMYRYISGHASDDVLFMNWAYEEDPAMAIPLDPTDEPHRYPIQLYHSVAAQNGGLAGMRVLEVGCGHGGGASYIMRTFGAESYVGLDLNAVGITFCRRRHHVPGLEFIEGDAEQLPFRAESFDAVINVESSHFYPHFTQFLSEVTRVLRPGGEFLYTDIRQWYQCDQWEADLEATGMRMVAGRDINKQVLRGMELNKPQWDAVWDRIAPGFLRSIGSAPTTGTPLSRDLENGKQFYRMYCLTKG
ncbi:phthiotriol/phenolphthiotriol dimycocerosates methyltransferase [[Mycobacterium] fortunisiensis]|uniref:phthiotriol/phenolphthiotriol dimycocerosates methyltransferase n=1 Tax=[Mycobacterium] fortunisiensis TaxID=2600579 RepID=UPI0027DED228|nr:class I SAM-dependent methyltransferase [[Mycobacterium] fortunisiensis]